MDDYNVPVLVDAKTEYTKQLVNILKPHLYEGIQSIYKDAYELCKENNDSDKVLMTFQNLLSHVPKWSQEIIENEYNRIVDQSRCDWLEDLVTAVFVSHTKILTAIRIGKKHKKINLKVPKIDHFIHKTYIQVAREFWKTPFLFDEGIATTEYQRNMKYSEDLISACINETIRQQLPVKHILKEYLGNDYEDEEDDSEINSETNDNNIKKMVKKEIENFNSEDSENLNLSEELETKISDKNNDIEVNDKDIKSVDTDSQGSNSTNEKGEMIKEDKNINTKEEEKQGTEKIIQLEEDKDSETNDNNGKDVSDKKEDNVGLEGGSINLNTLENDKKEIDLENLDSIEKPLENINSTNQSEPIKEKDLESPKEISIDTINQSEPIKEISINPSDKKEEISLDNINNIIDIKDNNKKVGGEIEEIKLDSIQDVSNNMESNLLDSMNIPEIDSNIDFFGTNNTEFESKKIDYENKNNVSNEVLKEFDQLNNNIRLNKKEQFNFFADAEETE